MCSFVFTCLLIMLCTICQVLVVFDDYCYVMLCWIGFFAGDGAGKGVLFNDGNVWCSSGNHPNIVSFLPSNPCVMYLSASWWGPFRSPIPLSTISSLLFGLGLCCVELHYGTVFGDDYSGVMTSQQLNVRNLGIGLHIQEEQCEKCPPAKSEPVSAN